MNEGEKNASWLDTPDPQRFIKNAAKFNDLMMMYLSLIHIYTCSNQRFSVKIGCIAHFNYNICGHGSKSFEKSLWHPGLVSSYHDPVSYTHLQNISDITKFDLNIIFISQNVVNLNSCKSDIQGMYT